jgi:hypothetical protein
MLEEDRKIIEALARELGPYSHSAAAAEGRKRLDTLPDGSSDWQRLRESVRREPTGEDYALLVDLRSRL